MSSSERPNVDALSHVDSVGQYSSSDQIQIPANTIRNLCDKLKDKRRLGGDEIESLIAKYLNANNEEAIHQILRILNSQLINSVQPNMRKGGLWALASASVALYRDAGKYSRKLVPPVLQLFTDNDNKVRFHACEAMYNIAKVARGIILTYFNDIFDGLCKLCADTDNQVKNASMLLDRLMKDIVTEDDFDIEKFIPLIKERILTNNPYIRQFLLGWIMVLDSVPDIDMLVYLPQFLDGLFKMLSESNKEIVNQASTVLEEFLTEIETMVELVDFENLIPIVIVHCQSNDDLTKQKALHWIHKFLSSTNNYVSSSPLPAHLKAANPKQLLFPFHSQILQSIIPNLSHSLEEIRKTSSLANKELIMTIKACNQVAYKEFISVIGKEIQNSNVQSREAALHWLHILLNKDVQQVMKYMNKSFEIKLLQCLGDSNDQVVSLDLEVLAVLSVVSEENFVKVLSLLMRLFRSEEILLKRAGYIIRQLSIMLNPENIFRVFARILLSEECEQSDLIVEQFAGGDNQVLSSISTKQPSMNHLEFYSVMVQTLNTILLTSKELLDLRNMIKRGLSYPESRELFLILYKSWCHNPVATLSLCLLAKAYKHASALVASFTEIEITVNFLVQIDNLVQLLESPIFADLRLQLLEPQKNPHLLKTLYGILMLLPQSPAYDKLSKRLDCVNTLSLLHIIARREEDISNKSKAVLSVTQNAVDVGDEEEEKELAELLKHFTVIQSGHKKTRNLDL